MIAPTARWLAQLGRQSPRQEIGPNDPHAALEQLYAQSDPWSMTSEKEQFRFAQTNLLIDSLLPQRLRQVLEFGCGEGHQSEWLCRVSDEIYGIDVSPTAIARARSRLPRATFAVGDFENVSVPTPAVGNRSDLVTACEVLYYTSSRERAVAQMSQLGYACLATFFASRASLVAPALRHIHGLTSGWFAYDDTVWLWAFWHNFPHDTED